MSKKKQSKCNNFTWQEIYKEIVEKIKDKTTDELKKLLSNCKDCQTDYLIKNKDFINLDLFTFFGSFNRDVKFENRMKILTYLKEHLKLNKNLPTDFNGIPTMNNQNSYFYWADNLEKADDLNKLNKLFKLAISDEPGELKDEFNACLEIDGVGISKLTTGLFWINPKKFLPIAGPVVNYLNKKDYKQPTNWDEYHTILQRLDEQDMAQISFQSFLSENNIDTILNKLQDNKKPKNIILTGIPGTGKTSTLMEYLKNNKEEIGGYEFVQFHPSYDYEDFIEGLKPIPSSNGQIEFKLVNGVFKALCKKAYSDPDNKTYIMVIDEINRANLSRVFGELLYCLEYRNEFISTKMTTYIQGLNDDDKKNYSVSKDNIGKFAIPENIIILGTMNEVDRSIDAFDLALRRRFIWEDIGFSEKSFMNYEGFCKNNFSKHRGDLLGKANKLNEKLSTDIGINYQLGHTYYYKIIDYYDGNFNSALCDLWEYHIKSIVREYCKIKFGENEINSKLSEYKKIVVGKNNCNG